MGDEVPLSGPSGHWGADSRELHQRTLGPRCPAGLSATVCGGSTCFDVEDLHMKLTVYLAGEIHTSWREDLIGKVKEKRSEEHTSELQSGGHPVCRLLLE